MKTANPDCSLALCRPLRFAAVAALLLPLATLVCAQTAQTASSNEPAENGEQGAITLSPFEVSSNQDQGFAAANTYAGGRLATPLDDTAAPYSVINQAMIQALGIENLRDVVDWSTDSYLGLDGSGGGFFFNLPVLGNTRGVIGSAYALRQTNFFPYFSPGDSFDVERYDIGRGPNQVLFGLGGLGGNEITMPKEAHTDADAETLSVLGGSYEHLRVTLDANEVAIPDKLAVRVDGLYESSYAWRDNNFKKARGMYGTMTYRPFKDTEIRINAEKGEEADAVAFLTLNDDFAGWDGHSVFNGPVTAAQLAGTTPTAGGTLLVNNGNNNGVTRYGSNVYVFSQYSGQNAIMSYTNMAETLGGGATPTTPIGGYTYANAGGISFATSGASLLGAYDVPGTRFATAAADSAFQLPSERFDNMPETAGSVQHYDDLDLTIDQHVGDNLFLELAGDENHTDNVLNDAQSGLQNTYIDINQTLPNGAPNPEFLQPYGQAAYRYIYHPNNNVGARAAAAYLRDFGKWGNYAINVIVADQEDYTKSRTYWLSIEQNADPREWYSSDTIQFRQYWYSPHTYAPPTGPIMYDNPFGGVSTTITPQWIIQPNGTNVSDTINRDAYGLVALSAKYFHNKLILLGAVRDDATEVYTRYGINQGQYPSNWNGSQIIWRPNAPANWNTLMYQPLTSTGAPSGVPVSATTRPTTNNAYGVPVPNPLYANDLFQDDFNPPELKTPHGYTKTLSAVYHITPWWSGFGDLSDAFQPNSSTTPEIDGTNLPNVNSHGFDVGTRFSFFDNRLYLAYTHFWNYSTGNHTVPNTVTSPINGFLAQPPEGATSTSTSNALGIPQLVSGGNDTQDDDNFGDEIEATASLVPGWRLTGSLSFPFFYALNADPKLRAYVAANQQNFITILEQDGATLDTTQHPNGAPGLASVPTLPPGTVALGAQNAATDYNSIYSNLASIVSGKQIQNSAAVLNLFTDYTIQSGFWKGVDIGIGDQYRGRNVVGYTIGNTIPNPSNPAQAIPDPNASAYDAIFVAGYNSVTGTLGYNFRIWKYPAFCNLRIYNLLDNRQIIYNNSGTSLRPYEGNYLSPARTQVPTIFGQFRAPINFTFTTTLTL